MYNSTYIVLLSPQVLQLGMGTDEDGGSDEEEDQEQILSPDDAVRALCTLEAVSAAFSLCYPYKRAFIY
jgi:hypothetical protein